MSKIKLLIECLRFFYYLAVDNPYIEFHLMETNFILSCNPPSIEEYNLLRELAGWGKAGEAVAGRGLAGSLFAVTIRDKAGTIIGMGRVVGDRGLYLHIQDVIIRPEMQKMGYGKLIMDKLMEYVRQQSGKKTMIGLMCAKGKEGFYRKYGFIDRPNDKQGPGMTIIVE
jgi:GNAT superfamily N-acetyltransferase